VTLAIGVDVGGTKVAAGVVDDDGRVLQVLRHPTPDTEAPAVAAVIARLVRDLQTAYPQAATVGIGAAGWIDRNRSLVYFAPNVPWRDEPLRADLEGRIDLPIVVENDGNATAWAEHRFGAGRGSADLICVTVGTGIGGGIVAAGGLYRGGFGVAAEFGHMRLVPGGHRCGCGNRGCWEQYCSGKALVREAREIASTDAVRGKRLLELAAQGLSGFDGFDSIAGLGVLDGPEAVDAIDGPTVTAAAEEGDPAAVEAFAVVGEWLGRGLANVAAAIDPGRFVIGGGVSDAGELLLGPARIAYARHLPGRGHRPEAHLVKAVLGPLAGLVGAADLSRRPPDFQ
jgi:glucokinase